MKSLKEYILNESEETVKGYHYAEIGTSEEQEDADAAYALYDKYSHNEITVDELIKKVNKEGFVNQGDEMETIHKTNCKVLGYSKDKKFFVTYDKSTGAFDTWECE